MTPAGLLGHGGGAVEGAPGTYVGSALYDISPEHLPALSALVVLPLAALAVHRWYRLLPPAVWPARLRALPVERRFTVWMLLTSAFVHAVIAATHGTSLWALAFGADAALLGSAAQALVTGRRRAGRLAALALLGSLLGLFVGIAAHETPDQVAMACKVVEIAGLLALGAPLTARRRRRLLATSGTLGVTVAVLLGVWTIALTGGEAGHQHGDSDPAAADIAAVAAADTAADTAADEADAAGSGEHAHAPTVGMAMPAGDGRPATPAQRRAAAELYRQVRTAIAPYADPAVAVAAGYKATGIRGAGFHADNPAYGKDGRMLDPARPETLVYATRADGTPVLLGAMFEVPGLRDAGPAVGGPLTVWHAHEQVCFGLLPPSLAGLTSPLGACPAGSVLIALTNEMIHVWTVPGAPEHFGDLPDEWLKSYLAAGSAAGSS
jgi:hypothetical protein